MSEEPAQRPRGSVLMYAVAFLLVLASAYLAVRGNTESSLKLVWTSIGISGLAVAVALTSLFVRRR